METKGTFVPEGLKGQGETKTKKGKKSKKGLGYRVLAGNSLPLCIIAWGIQHFEPET